MRGRWQALTILAGLGLFGLILGWALHGMYLDPWLLLAVGGLASAFGLALWATLVDYGKRWPAAIALICVAPIAHEIVVTVLEFPHAIANADLSALVFLIGSMGSVVAASTLLLMRIPPPPPAPIAPARIA